jgi:hypothetical protein
MDILVANPERFSHEEIRIIGALPRSNIYLAVSYDDVIRVLGSQEMDLILCRAGTEQEIAAFSGFSATRGYTRVMIGITCEGRCEPVGHTGGVLIGSVESLLCVLRRELAEAATPPHASGIRMDRQINKHTPGRSDALRRLAPAKKGAKEIS